VRESSQGSARTLEFLSTDPSEDTRVQLIDAWLPEAFRHYTPPR
jgi:hypothetical protein